MSTDTGAAAGKETICYCPNCEGWGTFVPEYTNTRIECGECGGEGIVRCAIPSPPQAPRPDAGTEE